MSRPLLICDCDEVLLHMMAPFQGWLTDIRGVDFDFGRGEFVDCFRQPCGTAMDEADIWTLLDDFFTTEMHRQPVVPGAADALARIAAVADVVILTNLEHHHGDRRTVQLAGHAMPYRVVTNQGPKGPMAKRIAGELSAGAIVFVDDLPQHHASVAGHLPDAARLHMIAEPALGARIDAAAAAHARIDDWALALPWILDRLDRG